MRGRRLQEEPLYATVKRTPRPPRSDGHIYHCPGLLLDAEQRSNQSNTNTSSKDGPMRVKLNEDSTDRRTSGCGRKGRDSKHLRKS
ncbi:hypothetical protein TNCT_53491 [Trichonephila clavata]|uniref:Uncharacterized protein n=1 Tax=Trichonephila clavata TaxID=2740835 RepID=A0A8X6IB78_TRICU|nr:hypothetical protein TNCT_53491 [Trichonephila clavata]